MCDDISEMGCVTEEYIIGLGDTILNGAVEIEDSEML